MYDALREQALAIFRAGLSASDPERLMEDVELPTIGPNGRLLILGAGKAAAHFARELERDLEGWRYEGRVIVKQGHGVPLERIAVEEGAHPVPDASSLEATRKLLADAAGLGPSDCVVFLLTGGASSLLVAPAAGLELSDKMRVTETLLRTRATIGELNAVRKHLSAVKGGRLLERMLPARVLTLCLSDVLGDDPSAIGSGPTVPDPTTFRDALDVLSRYGVGDDVPERVWSHLRRGAAGELPETPKPGDPRFAKAEHHVLASNRMALAAAATEAESLGYRVRVFARDLEGEVHAQARAFCEALRELPPKSALLAGGELTLDVTGDGLGGRSQEFALVAARELSGTSGVMVLAAGTDGTDGPTDAAGAFADGTVWEKGRDKGLDPEGRLARNDAYRFFDGIDGLLRTGPTGTNVNDLMIGLVG